MSKRENKDYLFEFGLPGYLQHDLDEVKKHTHGDSFYDCYLNELYGSINSAFVDEEISEECATYLRNKYYFGNLK